ncbi:MAG: tRNA preQ1(34) S-adenosylmethionine ribosyltransferase-isomerase QueA [Candidatus Saccharibacteria bacterium]
MKGSKVLSEYDYDLPAELLASRPIEPRDSSRLFVYDTGKDQIYIDAFSNLAAHLPAGSLLVFNDTKVVPARVDLRKETGGKVECLFLVNEMQPGDRRVKILADRRITAGQKLTAGPGYDFEVVSQDGKLFVLELKFDPERLEDLLGRKGRTPVPKYLGETGLSEELLRARYQTMFAARPASVAAPTASLHFTPQVMEKFGARGIETARISLHVGLGTFAPVTEDDLQKKRLHTEIYRIPAESRDRIAAAKKTGRPVVAVGTTSARALESAAVQPGSGSGEVSGETSLFIYPPYRFRTVDALVTNFHLPQSSLMCLVDAFLKHKQAGKNLVNLYQVAIREKFRFYSFGDAMLIK